MSRLVLGVDRYSCSPEFGRAGTVKPRDVKQEFEHPSQPWSLHEISIRVDAMYAKQNRRQNQNGGLAAGERLKRHKLSSDLGDDREWIGRHNMDALGIIESSPRSIS